MKYFATKISDNISETPEGFLVCIGVPIARTGAMDYGRGETPLEVGDDDVVVIDREEDEVFRPETIASFEGKPLTIKHPEDFVDPTNWSTLAKGSMQNVRRGEGEFSDSLIADILITDAVAISLVKNGLRGLSCGYEAEYTQTGEGRGKQTNIIGNHLALVEEGRAGSAYAINDKKGVLSMKQKTMADKFKSIFAKAIDESMMDEDMDKDKKGAKDAEVDKEDDKKDDKKSEDAGAYDDLVKMVKDLGEKLDGMKPESKDEPEADGEDEEVAPGLEDRLKTLEMAVQKLMEKMGNEAGDEDEEEMVGDEDEEESEDELCVMGKAGDTASRAEILAPGIKHTKDVKVKALRAAYGTKDGKKVIESLTGGKPPAFNSPEKVNTLFIAASELMKASRGSDLSKTKVRDFSSTVFADSSVMTAEKMNEINAKKYKQA